MMIQLDADASLDTVMANLVAETTAHRELRECWLVWGRDVKIASARPVHVTSTAGDQDGWLVCGPDKVIWQGIRDSLTITNLVAVGWQSGLSLLWDPPGGPGLLLFDIRGGLDFLFHDKTGEHSAAIFASVNSDRAAPFGPMWVALRALPADIRLVALKIPYQD